MLNKRYKMLIGIFFLIIFGITSLPIFADEENVETEMLNTDEESVEIEILDSSKDTLEIEESVEEISEDIPMPASAKETRGVEVEENTYIAYTIVDLKNYASIPDAIIHFGNDIEWTSQSPATNAIVMANGVTVSGKDYYTGEIHTYRMDTGVLYDRSFQIRSNNVSVRFEDINFIGTGYYGIVHSASLNPVITYHNVNYTTTNGQPIYMPYNGKAILSGDCNFVQTNGGSLAQEFGEFVHLEFAPNSNVNIQHDSYSTDHGLYGFMWSGLGEYTNLTVTVGEQANVSIKTTKDFVRSTGVNDKFTLNIGKGANFTLDQTKAVPNTQFIYSGIKFASTINVEENATFNYQGNSAQPMLNFYYGGGLYVSKEATATIDNANTGAAIASDNANTKVEIRDSKLTRFSSQKAYPMALTNNVAGNTAIARQAVEVSIDRQNYQSLGFVSSLKMNQRYNASSIVNVDPTDWKSKDIYLSLAPEIKSLVFKNVYITIQEPVTNRSSSVTVQTYPNAEIAIRVRYEDQQMKFLQMVADSNGHATFDLGGKYLLAGEEIFAAAHVDSFQAAIDYATVLDVTDVEGTLRRLEISKGNDMTALKSLIDSTILVTSGSISYDVDTVDISQVGVYNVEITITKYDQIVNIVQVPVFVYDENSEISTFDEENPLVGTMIHAKNFERKSLEVTGDLNFLVTGGSEYQAWDQNGLIRTGESIAFGGLTEIPLAGQYAITFTVNEFSKTIALTVSSENQMIDVSIPKTMFFGTLASTADQQIYSPEYTLTNQSDAPISVYVSKMMVIDVPSNFTLVSDESEFEMDKNQAVLNLHSNTESALVKGLNPQMLETHFLDLLGNQKINMHFNGTYNGTYNTVLKPKYKMVLRFEYKK